MYQKKQNNPHTETFSASIARFGDYLVCEEKSRTTVEKYLRDLNAFAAWLAAETRERNDLRAIDTIEKSMVLAYKEHLVACYAPASVNSVLSSLNSFFTFCGHPECRVKTLRIQRQIFARSERELSKAEYERLLAAARADKRLYYLLQTICATGIRVSELRFITAEAVKKEQAMINCKGKMRMVILPKKLCCLLSDYMKEKGIVNGSVFVTRSGKPLDRSNIWLAMKKLCERAGVEKHKVFPHNLRHLFARTYYSLQKDVVRLADILGHASINTTRIYTMESGEVHKNQLQQLGLLRC